MMFKSRFPFTESMSMTWSKEEGRETQSQGESGRRTRMKRGIQKNGSILSKNVSHRIWLQTVIFNSLTCTFYQLNNCERRLKNITQGSICWVLSVNHVLEAGESMADIMVKETTDS
jgi:hypothetical protein